MHVASACFVVTAAAVFGFRIKRFWFSRISEHGFDYLVLAASSGAHDVHLRDAKVQALLVARNAFQGHRLTLEILSIPQLGTPKVEPSRLE